MKFKSLPQLNRDSQELDSWFDSEMKKFARISDLAKAVFNEDGDILAKSTNTELEIAKAAVAGIRKDFAQLSDASLRDLIPAWLLRKMLNEWRERNSATASDKRRSRRVNEIMANALPSYGPWGVLQ